MPAVIEKQISKKQIYFWLLSIQLILLYFPILQLFSLANGSIPASLCYFFSLVFVSYLVKHIKTLRLPPWYFTALYVYVMLLTVLRIPQYGISKSVLHWTFGFYLLVVILNVGADFQREDWLHMLETAACIFAIVHFVFILFHADVTVFLLKGYFWGSIDGACGVYLPSLTRGGRNLDCTWMGLGAFFVRGKKKAVYVTYVILFSFLGSSRVGVIAIALVILWSLLYDPIYKLTYKKIKWYVLYAVIMLATLVLSGTLQGFLARMVNGIRAPGQWLQLQENIDIPDSIDIIVPDIEDSVQKSPGILKSSNDILSGRAAIWHIVPQMVKDDPFGHGVGNAMRVMKAEYGFTGYEDVVHNVLFQWLLDEGIVGGLWYIGLVLALFVSQWKCRPRFFEDPFAAYFLTYVVLSLVQFHGAEALMIFVLGIYLIQLDVRCICLDKLFSKTRKG